MRHYKEGIHRKQNFLLPPQLEDYVTEDNPVRAIDTYIDSLDVKKLGFKNAAGELTAGQPAYPPKALLKLYMYGYLHRVRSSRRLERECHINLEVIWLVEGLRPGYKTIADFRKDNIEALKAVNRDFVLLCKELNLFGRELVSIDSSDFHGNVGKKNIYTQGRLVDGLKRIEKHIEEYLKTLEEADVEEVEPGSEAAMDKSSMQEKLAKLRKRQQKHHERLKKLKVSGKSQIAEVDEDARLLTKGRQTIAGYKVQVGVDDKYKLIAAHQVTQDPSDQQQLEPMAKAAKAELGVEELDVTADAGYFNAQQIKNCKEANITVYVPEPDKTAQARQQGRFDRKEFTYCDVTNTYTCPAGKVLKQKTTTTVQGKVSFVYKSLISDCAQCPLKVLCLPSKTRKRQILRWEHEDVIEEHRRRMTCKGSKMMSKRACLSEHPFGTLKLWCGWTHFLLRGLEKVRAELSMLVLSYNFKRVINILGLDVFRSFCLQR
jgi:transposase